MPIFSCKLLSYFFPTPSTEHHDEKLQYTPDTSSSSSSSTTGSTHVAASTPATIQERTATPLMDEAASRHPGGLHSHPITPRDRTLLQLCRLTAHQSANELQHMQGTGEDAVGGAETSTMAEDRDDRARPGTDTAARRREWRRTRTKGIRGLSERDDWQLARARQRGVWSEDEWE